MKNDKFYRVEVAGMVLDEKGEFCIPNVIGNKAEGILNNNNLKYVSIPMFAREYDGILTDVVTGETIKLEKKASCEDYDLLAKNIKTNKKPEIVAFSITPVKVSKVCGSIIQLDSDDIDRYAREVKRLKEISTHRYIQQNKINEYKEDKYIKKLMLDYIDSIKSYHINNIKENSEECRIVKK